MFLVLTCNVYSLATLLCPLTVVQRSKYHHHDTRSAQQQDIPRHIPGHMTCNNKRRGCWGRLRILIGRVLVVTGLCISILCLGTKFTHEQLFAHVYTFHFLPLISFFFGIGLASSKLRPNDRNMSATQHIATLLGSTCCVSLPCCDVLRHVGCC